MDRIIEVKVNGNYISKDNKNAGVKGEANATKLRITFDEGWRGYAKRVTFWDALGNNPTKIILDDIDEQDVAIPGEAMTEAGMLTFVIDGFLGDKRQRSVSDRLCVKDAPLDDNAGEPAETTPPLTAQLQKEIQDNKAELSGRIDDVVGELQGQKDETEKNIADIQKQIDENQAINTDKFEKVSENLDSVNKQVNGEIDQLKTKKADLVNGKVPANQLPSFVDDVVEGKLISLSGVTVFSINGTPVTPEDGKIYVDTLTNKQFRWSGSQYIEISESLALGETESTAYSGAKGKKLAEDIEGLKANKVDKEIGYGLATIGEITEGFLTKKTNKTISVKDYIEDTPDGHIIHSGGGTVKIPAYMSDLNDDIGYVKGEAGKGLSTNDFTTAEKNKLAGLENYDDTDIKRQIETLGYGNTLAINGVQNLNSYGTADVYILQDSVDYISEDGRVIEMLKWDYSGMTIAFPEGVIEVNADVPRDSELFCLPLTCHKLIFPKTLKNFNIYSIAMDEIDTNCVEEIILYADPHDSNFKARLPQKICFNNSIRKITCNYGSTEISFSSPIVDEVDINSEIVSEDEEHISLDVRNTHKVKLNLEDWSADEFNPPRFTIYGYEGTYAEEYAKDKNIEFVNIGSDYSIQINNSTATESTIKPNEYYTFAGNEATPLSSLTVTLDTASTTKLDEFMFSFETPSDISSFSFGVLTDESVEIKWIKEPNLKPNYIYEVSVVNGVGVIAGTAKEVA